MQQTEFQKLLAASYAEFERRVRNARQRAAGLAGVDGFQPAPTESKADAEPMRIEELVA